MLGVLTLILIAAMVGLIADALEPGAMPGGWLACILAGIVGALLGSGILSLLHLPEGPRIEGIAIVPALAGAVLIVGLYGFVAARIASRRV